MNVKDLATIKSLPKTIRVNEKETFSVKEQTAFFKEMDDDISVAFKVLADHRCYKENDNGAISCSNKVEHYGDYVMVSKDATLEEIAGAVNECIENVRKLMLGEA